ncbi:hypothetical protein VCHC21A1_2957, partial [Vibrio cholerae HC-21A1]
MQLLCLSLVVVRC